jgi:hypothetical protein
MAGIHDSPHDLDELISAITGDCYNKDKAHSGFEVAFESGLALPLSATVVGEAVEVFSVRFEGCRRGLMALCRRNGRPYEIALLGVDLSGTAAAAPLVAAYRRWLGA